MTLQNPVSGNDTGLTPLQRCLDLIGQMDRDQLERFLATVADKGPNDTPQKAPSPGQTFQQAREILEDALVDLSGLVGTLDYLMVDIGTISEGDQLRKEVRNAVCSVTAATVRAMKAVNDARAAEWQAWRLATGGEVRQ